MDDRPPAGRRGRRASPAGFDLDRFRAAQDRGGTYRRALAELRAGRKASHWIWFVFPQIEGLGRSPTARAYAISSLAEARAYLADPLLGTRLRECCEALLALDGADPVAVMGPVDALKLRSSLTLFARADPAEPRFRRLLRRYYAGAEDAATLERLPSPSDSDGEGNRDGGGGRSGGPAAGGVAGG